MATAWLAVAVWDGVTDTVPAYEPRGPVWRPGDGAEPVPNAGLDESADVDNGGRYQQAFNRWLREVRADAATNASRSGAG